MILEKCLQSMNYDTDLIIPLSSRPALLLLPCVHIDKNEQKEMVLTFENYSIHGYFQLPLCIVSIL